MFASPFGHGTHREEQNGQQVQLRVTFQRAFPLTSFCISLTAWIREWPLTNELLSTIVLSTVLCRMRWRDRDGPCSQGDISLVWETRYPHLYPEIQDLAGQLQANVLTPDGHCRCGELLLLIDFPELQ